MAHDPTAAVSIDPATGKEIERFPYLDAGQRDHALDRAIAGFRAWRDLAVAQRGDVLSRVAELLRGDQERLAGNMTRQMGKTIIQARAEVEKCAGLCDWFAANGAAFLADEPTTVADDKAYVSYLPLGVVLAVMPWNFPLWQVMRAAVPIMMAGNGFLLKHAANVQRSAIDLVGIFEQAGAPDGAISVFNVERDEIEKVLADDRIAAVTLTGSGRAGGIVAAAAGAAVKKVLLELGGSDPFIVLADADLDGAVEAAIEGRYQNNGEICIAAKRMILEEPIAERFTAIFLDRVRALKVGDPMDEDTYIGPMARVDLRDQLHRQVEDSVAQGARLLLGGEVIGPEGAAFYAPTVLGGVRKGMPAFDEETFGPVAALIVARDAEDAVAIANDSRYGLSGAIWSRDVARAKALGRRLETGGVFINGFAASDPRTPIGGVKRSGYGRELSHFGIRAFTNAQLVWEGHR